MTPCGSSLDMARLLWRSARTESDSMPACRSAPTTHVLPGAKSHSGRILRLEFKWRDACMRRMGEIFPDADIAVLRGTEGARMKETYRRLSQQYGITWKGRIFDRKNPERNDAPNQAINHVVAVVEACAMVAVAVTGTLPQLGFIHEDSGNSLCLDLADLFRDTVTLPVAFAAAREVTRHPDLDLERMARRLAGQTVREKRLIPMMIDRLKDLFDGNDGNHHT
ncbi:CRISPR-associated endonuclease Cas1 [compost metagenome]